MTKPVRPLRRVIKEIVGTAFTVGARVGEVLIVEITVVSDEKALELSMTPEEIESEKELVLINANGDFVCDFNTEIGQTHTEEIGGSVSHV